MKAVSPQQVSGISSLIDRFSIELIPSSKVKTAELVMGLPTGTQVFLPVVDSTKHEDIVSTAVQLKKAGMNPVPHVPARRVTSEDMLARYVQALKSEADIDAMLVLGGDKTPPAGPFSSSLDILQSGILTRNGISSIGFAGHPEGHPIVPDRELMQAMIEKVEHAKKQNLKPFIVTQFSFDAKPYASWYQTFVEPSVGKVPVHFGIPGLAGLRTLMKFSAELGVGASLSLVRKNITSALKLATEFQPDQLVSDLATQLPEENYPGQFRLHFYPFGSFKKTVEWATARPN